ncbi:TPA: hypothetical protein DEW47_00705 [Patescibacteria group bacterium]|nr:MAG: hypothetical protein UT71_C0017G0009 [Parcubacteria group bacterium GW2011_GWF2_40_10]KKR47501.1 MAG: hypothetical protein UT83_C0008G0009 [Parcubacteria group bacterium GW2011_GWA2_40_143]KKR59920.1 MAG: hypothetical protein UT97_C0008G0010 [Parcubacteria group bacterium GW2011_GWC2_40_31]KKR76043.1 MAG: hypothetical protein UU20_C0035G0002 [Parcubacteria group bacterium GW2011_GWE2_40_8]HBB56532.1 hypothetical protein [Patescibacteria group bacterium]
MSFFAKKNTIRILFDIIFFLFIFLLPWYVAAPVIAFSIIFFNNFWEGVFAALAIDSFYYMPSNSPDLRFGIFFFSAVLLLLLVKLAKSKIRLGGLGVLN